MTRKQENKTYGGPIGGKMIGAAAAQMLRRPKDERFDDLNTLVKFLERQRKSSFELKIPFSEARWGFSKAGDLTFGGFGLNSFAFEKGCRLVKAPSKYLIELEKATILKALNEGWLNRQKGATALGRRTVQGTVLRDISSQQYKRVWDIEVIQEIMPQVKGFLHGGLYASDRDVFVDFFNPDMRIKVLGEELFPGTIWWNSEVGERTIGGMGFWVRSKCSNHQYWGERFRADVKIRHIGPNVLATFKEAVGLVFGQMMDFAKNSRGELAKQIERSAKKIALKDEENKKDLKQLARRVESTQVLLLNALTVAEHDKRAQGNFDPRSYYGLAQGVTLLSQKEPNADLRYEMDKIGERLLLEGARR